MPNFQENSTLNTSANVTTAEQFSKENSSVRVSGFLPWDNPDNVITYATYLELDSSVTCYVIPVLCFLGVSTNLLNIIVFYRQGLRERMNLCLFCLALTDLFFVLCFFVSTCYCLIQSLRSSNDDEWKWYVRRFILGPSRGFMYSSGCLTMVISVERCMCVTMPMKAARLISTRSMALLICACVLFLHLVCLQYTLRFDVAHVEDPFSGDTILTMVPSSYYIQQPEFFDIVANVFLTFTFPVSFAAVATIATVVTVVQLQGVVSWRHKAAKSASASDRNLVALSKMLVIVSAIFILCSLPSIILAIVSATVSDFTVEGRYSNVFHATHLLGMVAMMVNSSVNFFVYLLRSSRFRNELRQFISCPGAISLHGKPGTSFITKTTDPDNKF